MLPKKSFFGLLALLLALIIAAQGSLTASASSDSQKFVVSVDNSAHFSFTDSGAFNTPVAASGPGPLLSGSAYEWTFYANPGERLSLATMLVQSNDWFLAPDELGIPLYHGDGTAVSGDVTAYVKLWDSGTEGDQAPGLGEDQAPRQSGPNTGPADPTAYVRQVLTDAIPNVNELALVTLHPGGNGRFTVRIKNISENSSFATPFAPGVGVVHTAPAPLFINGLSDLGQGLEALAEDGDPSGLAAVLAARTGINTPLAPVAWTVNSSVNALFTTGQAASAGLESLAEDGDPGSLVAELGGNSGAAAIPHNASGPGPIFPPTGNYSFEITAVPGDHLSLAFMFVQSNDWFYGLNNLPLFDINGNPRSGDATHYGILYDAGTELNETPGFGLNQAPRQSGPNTGAAQGGVIRPVTADRFNNPADVIHITVTPVN